MIQSTCRDLLQARRRVTLRQVTEELRRRHGAAGKNDRVARILREAAGHFTVPCFEGKPEAEILRLQESLRGAEARERAALQRAELSEKRERSHQDLWARRIAERMDENDRQLAAAIKRHEREASVKYLQLHQRIAELERENAKLSREGGKPRSLGN